MSGLNEEEWEAARALMRAFTHDLNNLISPLFLYTEMLQESLSDPALKQRAEAILQRSQAMKALVDGSRWVYRGDEDAEQHVPEAFFRRLSAVTRSFFQQGGVEAYWVVASKAEPLPASVITGRFILAEKVRLLAVEAAHGSSMVIIFRPAGSDVVLRAYIGERAATAASRFMLAPSATTVLPEASIEGLLSQLSGCNVIEVQS